jgi:aryl-alcohol dehydrogenase-like predicted oxidoreductase
MLEYVQLGPHRVSRLALGCMGMAASYGPRDPKECIATIHAALDHGINHFDTAEGYGPYVGEELLGKALTGHRERAVVATKFGFNIRGGQIKGLCGTPEQARSVCEASLRRLKIQCIDVYYLHRLDPQVPIEDVVGAMANLVTAGKVRALGLSEVSPATLRRACAVHPIAALQTEYSLWERHAEQQLHACCKELGVRFVAYSPLGRGFLTGQAQPANELGLGDSRRRMPRFQGENYGNNLAFVRTLQDVAAKQSATPAQVALAWVLAAQPTCIALFGSSRRATLSENVKSVALELSDADLTELSAVSGAGTSGDRYFAGAMAWIDRKK